MRKLKILVYGINYAPESIGIGKYTTEMCEWFAGKGHEVEVITAMPSYPFWKIMPGYRGRWWHTENKNQVKIRRCPLYVPSKVTGKTRIVHELSFALSSSFYWFISLFKKFDVIICIAPPLQTGIFGLTYKMFHRTLLIYHIQDLQLDAAKQLGLIKNNSLLAMISSVEKFILKRSDFISTISEGMRRNILAKGVPPESIISLNNWIDTEFMSPQPIDPQMRQMFGVDSSKKLVLYSGNIGEKQGLEIIITVAEKLSDTNIVFVIIGDGAFKRTLQERVSLKKLDHHIKFFPLQPYESLNKILNMADLHLVLQKKAAADLVMPSKLTAILSVGGFAIVTTEKGTSLYDIIYDNKLAVIVEPEDATKLTAAIVEAVNADSTKYRSNARSYAIANLEKQTILTVFQAFLEKNFHQESNKVARIH
jgi:colanic acid biosynthesis glycosyl transferase WcaI